MRASPSSQRTMLDDASNSFSDGQSATRDKLAAIQVRVEYLRVPVKFWDFRRQRMPIWRSDVACGFDDVLEIEWRNRRRPIAIVPGEPAKDLHLFCRIVCWPHVRTLLDAQIGHDRRRFPQHVTAIDKGGALRLGLSAA